MVKSQWVALFRFTHTGRPKSSNYPKYMTADSDGGGWRVINPTTGRRKRFQNEAEARAAALKLNEWLEAERQTEAWADGRPTISTLVAKWREERMPHMPWDDGTRRNAEYMLARIGRDFGSRIIARTDCMDLENWMAKFCKNADQWNKWRYILVLLWKLAMSRKLATSNGPEKIETRSTSKKIAANRKVRQKLDVAGFRAIHEKAPPWLQIAMEQSLVTLQARKEICNTRYSDYRDGWHYVIRDKVSGESEMGFIRIAVTPQLDEIRRRSLKACGLYANLEPAKRPTFHEIRGLGGRIYAAQGVPEAAIQALRLYPAILRYSLSY